MKKEVIKVIQTKDLIVRDAAGKKENNIWSKMLDDPIEITEIKKRQ